jgi:hypothetical protein
LAKIKRAVTLGHQANLGEGVEEVKFEAGETVTLLKEWADRYLCKKSNGMMFNLPKDLVEK